MIRTYSCEAIIIARRNIGEADKLLTLFTREYGKKKVIAKGIRKVGSRRGPYLELFSHLKLLLHPGRTFDFVTEVNGIEPFLLLRKRLERIGYGYIGLELTERLTAENQESEPIFKNLSEFIRKLNHSSTNRSDAEKVLVSFKQFLLSELGFIEKQKNAVEDWLDERIEFVLEAPLKSPLLLTNIQMNL